MDLIDQLLPVLQEKERSEGYDSLSVAEKTVLDVNGVEADVNNGGFHQFFFNSAGDRVAGGVAALKRIGAHQAAAIVEEACARFSDGGPSADRFTRQKQLDELDLECFEDLDDRFFEYPDPIAQLLIAYWSASHAT
jgi:hypothetical protein